MTEKTGILGSRSDMQRRRRLLTIFVVAAVTLGMLAPAGASAAKQPRSTSTSWAPAATAPIHPGVQTVTAGSGQCTSNFVFQDASGTYLGQAAHCSGIGEATDTDGCLAESLPLGTEVEIEGASQPGTLVYNSWLTMQAEGETDEETCAFNDFALVKVSPDDVAKINPSVPRWGGPVALGDATKPGEHVYSYGNSSLRGGLSILSPKKGLSLGTTPDGWSHTVYTVSPGIPGDSGSSFLDAEGRAFGTLSTLAFLPLPGSNGVSDLARQLAYAKANSTYTGLQLIPGTEPFRPGLRL